MVTYLRMSTVVGPTPCDNIHEIKCEVQILPKRVELSVLRNEINTSFTRSFPGCFTL